MTAKPIDALITGASRGVGEALAQRYARRGPTVATARRPDPGAASGIEWHSLDVRDPDDHIRLAEDLRGRPLGLLVCNAGVYLDKGDRIEDGFTADLWAETFATNVTGVFLTIRHLLPNLTLEPGGKIAILSSIMGSSERAGGGGYIYRASKAAVLNLGLGLAADLKPQGVAVGIYHPGWVQTDMGGSAASVTVDQSADGLAHRFDALSLDTTGCFETFDGQTLPV